MAKRYSLAGVVGAYGATPITGFGEGGAWEAEKKNDDFEAIEMVDGEVIFSFTGSRLWTLKIILAQTSLANNVLAALRQADLISSRTGAGGSGIVPFTLTDTNGSSLFSSARARIAKPPKHEFTNKAKDREWTILCADVNDFVGGSL